LDRRLDGPQSQSGRFGEEKNVAPAGIKTPAVQPVPIPTELSRLLRHTERKENDITQEVDGKKEGKTQRQKRNISFWSYPGKLDHI
jgi:hypothetical protein